MYYNFFPSYKTRVHYTVQSDCVNVEPFFYQPQKESQVKMLVKLVNLLLRYL